MAIRTDERNGVSHYFVFWVFLYFIMKLIVADPIIIRCRDLEPRHFETADFAVQAIWFTLDINRFGATFAFKQDLGLFLDGFLPQPNLDRMDSKFLAYLVDGLAAAQGF